MAPFSMDLIAHRLSLESSVLAQVALQLIVKRNVIGAVSSKSTLRPH